MGYFRLVMLEVHGLELAVTMSALLRRLPVGGFFHSLTRRFPHNLLDLLSHSKKYINAEGFMAVKRKENKECKHP